MLKFKPVNTIEVGDWNELVQETYGNQYNFQQQDGCKGRGTHYITIPEEGEDYEKDTIPEVINGEEMGVSFAAWLARDPKEWNGAEEDKNYIRLFWTRNFYPDVQILANDLHAKGLIPQGEYVINIDW